MPNLSINIFNSHHLHLLRRLLFYSQRPLLTRYNIRGATNVVWTKSQQMQDPSERDTTSFLACSYRSSNIARPSYYNWGYDSSNRAMSPSVVRQHIAHTIPQTFNEIRHKGWRRVAEGCECAVWLCNFHFSWPYSFLDLHTLHQLASSVQKHRYSPTYSRVISAQLYPTGNSARFYVHFAVLINMSGW